MAVKYTVKIITHSMNVRTGPGTSYKIFDWVQKGETYTSSKTQNGWYYIDSLKGWVSGNSKYVSVTAQASQPTPPSNNTSNKNNETTKKENNIDGSKTETVKKQNPSHSYSIDTSARASSSVNQYETNITTSYGEEEYSTVHMNVNDKNPGSGLILKTYSTGGYNDEGSPKHKAGVNGLVNFAEHNFGRSLSSRTIDGLDKALDLARQEMNVYGAEHIPKLFRNFNRFKMGMPNAHLHKAYPYIFFTRPDIDILDSTGKQLKPEIDRVNQTFAYLFKDNPDIIRSLNKTYSENHRFNVFLSNMARSFEPPDEVIRTIETGETYTGWKTVYGKNTNESNSAGQFNIQYRDTNNLDIMKMHKAWIDYMNGVYRGAISVDRRYIHKKILNYACSVYFIVCAEDGETILSWSKYYGVFPINVPLSTLGWAAGSPIKIPDFTISYMYALKDDYDPATITEFNQLSTAGKRYAKIFNSGSLASSQSWVNAPYIDIIKNKNGTIKYKLRFRV